MGTPSLNKRLMKYGFLSYKNTIYKTYGLMIVEKNKKKILKIFKKSRHDFNMLVDK